MFSKNKPTKTEIIDRIKTFVTDSRISVDQLVISGMSKQITDIINVVDSSIPEIADYTVSNFRWRISDKPTTSLIAVIEKKVNVLKQVDGFDVVQTKLDMSVNFQFTDGGKESLIIECRVDKSPLRGFEILKENGERQDLYSQIIESEYRSTYGLRLISLFADSDRIALTVECPLYE